jgi:hypothetical protein
MAEKDITLYYAYLITPTTSSTEPSYEAFPKRHLLEMAKSSARPVLWPAGDIAEIVGPESLRRVQILNTSQDEASSDYLLSHSRNVFRLPDIVGYIV